MTGNLRAGPADTGPLTAIRRQFPRWRPWRSDEGRFWATRTGRRGRPSNAPYWWAMTVDGDTAAELGEALARQERWPDPG